MTGLSDHICSTNCVFCRVLKNERRSQQNVDDEVMERVKELQAEKFPTHTSHTPPGTANKRDELEKLALLDSLTELYNQQSFMKELKHELKRARRYKHRLSLLLISIDGFQHLLDKYGTLTGNVILKVVARVIKGCVREDLDSAARYQTHLLAVLLPETDVAGAAVVAERIRQGIGSQAITHNWHSFNVTASVGLASFPVHAADQNALVAYALKALEQSSIRGGDRASACS